MRTDDQTTFGKNKLIKAHLVTLNKHRIHIVDEGQLRKTQVKVLASQFEVLSSQRCISPLPMQVNEKFTWEEITSSYLYYEKELIEFALQCLYLTNTILGECIVQRCRKKDLAVVEIRPISYQQLTDNEKQLLAGKFQQQPTSADITYGSDLELMLFSKKTNKFIRADQLAKNSEIGFDDAISTNGQEVSHPVFEVRPKPANSMTKLHANLLRLHSKLAKETSVNQVEFVADANPFDRFFLGGHIHFGNTPFNFHHVRLLDCFLAIPFSLIETRPSFERRNYYGRLGSVRKNNFKGFEYRVLPTWFKQIPEFLPVLQWIEFLIKNADQLPSSKINELDLKAYYHKKYQQRSLEEWVEDQQDLFLGNGEDSYFLSFVTTLKKLR